MGIEQIISQAIAERCCHVRTTPFAKGLFWLS